MATSSITKNFVISGEKQAEIFADAIEASANCDSGHKVKVAVTQLSGSDEIIKFMAKREKTNA